MQFKKIAFFLLFLLSYQSFSQFKAENLERETITARKQPVSFTHQPIILLKITPTALLGRDNVLQYGAELAPPFGKLSFGFDYGKGKGSWSFNKDQKNKHPEQRTTIFRGEIRAYFSDWYPFYALDKKPFGRYYSLEFVQKKLEYDINPEVLVYGGVSVPGKTDFQVENIERALHLKFGKHFLVSKWFFVDAFAGIGIGQYSSKPVDVALEQTKTAFSFKRPLRDHAASKGLFLSKTAGIRLCLAL